MSRDFTFIDDVIEDFKMLSEIPTRDEQINGSQIPLLHRTEFLILK